MSHVRHLALLAVLATSCPLSARSYILHGGQKSQINYRLSQLLEPSSTYVKKVSLTYVRPQSFVSPTYNQEITKCSISFSVPPSQADSSVDRHGNGLITYTWLKPKKEFTAEMTVEAVTSLSLKEISSTAPFPAKNLPPEVKPYLAGTAMVPVDDPSISTLAHKLVKGATTEYGAVQKILTWLIDHMQYVLTPSKYDALYSLESRKGNCQNYSHLAAALMRSCGIPVRIVNGITMKQPFSVSVGNSYLTLGMAQGRHSWVEVYFPDLGWVPFDPQQTELFVSNRYIRTEVGIDNEESSNDGLIRWTREKGRKALLGFHEGIEAKFISDEVSIKGIQQEYGPRDLLLQPPVAADFVPVATPEPPAPVAIALEQLLKMSFDISYAFGNLEFPEGVNLAFARESMKTDDAETQVLRKNFLVETAEYVTGETGYAQAFVVNKPVDLGKIGLALHKFGGGGELWVELRENKDDAPGAVGAKSTPVPLSKLSSDQGYFWVDFDFGKRTLLTPDRYWIVLGHNGGPIVNWFYTYGKTVGPVDGTRSRKDSKAPWRTALSYEFNYRIVGKTPK